MVKNVHRQNKLDEQYKGPYLIHNVMDNSANTLMDQTSALLSRDVPTRHIVDRATVNPKQLPVCGILFYKNLPLGIVYPTGSLTVAPNSHV